MKRPELEASRLEGLAALAPALAIERLVAMKQALPTCGDPRVLATLAQALPARVAGLSPEVCLAVHDVALELAPYGPRIPDDVLALSPRLRTAWLRVALVAKVLELETRRDVALGLMASLGHGRHEPTLASLLERLVDRDYRIRQGAHAALRAWGRDVIPALRHAAKRARPDHRRQFEALIEALE